MTHPALARLVAYSLLLLVLLIQPLEAQTLSKSGGKGAEQRVPGTPTDFRSQNFLLHTDLSREEAKELLTRLETMLTLISKYWAKPSSGLIECYVAKDLKNWSQNRMDAEGRAVIEDGAGVTITSKISGDRSFVAKSMVYAVADRGTPQHEAVHAYCQQTFGNTGPLWYSEGMAEMGQYWREGDRAVRCDENVVRYIRSVPPKSLNEIVNAQSFTGDSWENYCWRWALCHLLANNPNYSANFRPLGLGFLTGKNVSFEQVYGAQSEQISFEYLFFLKHFDVGYRVDLCSFNWKLKFRPLAGSTALTTKIDANEGWQGTAANVTADASYEYTATGKWQTVADATTTDADGDEQGNGRLVGTIMNDYKLTPEFELGASGSFVAPTSGMLYLRARDAWNDLAENKGSVSVKLKAKPKSGS